MGIQLKDIEGIVGPNGVLIGDDVLARPLNWMGGGKREARAIVRPKSTEDVAKILKLCNAAGQSVVVLGGLTGLVQATDSKPEDLVISLERMNNVLEIDPIGKTMVVEAGTPLQKVHEAANAEGLQFNLELGARGSCTIGGNIATNAGGNQVIRYGMMRNQVLGLEAVLADGTVLSSMNTLLKNNTGYDLKHLFIGGEGTLGIVTKAVLRLFPAPKSTNTALVAVDSFAQLTDLFQLVSEKLAGGLSAFEVMWADHYDLLTKETKRHVSPIENDHAYYVVIEQQGALPEKDMELFASTLERAFEKEIISDAVLAQSESQAQGIWNIREDIEGLAMVLMPGFIFDVSLPIRDMENYIAELRENIKSTWGDKARLIVFGHLGDGNLHLVISVGDGGEAARAKVNDIVYKPLQNIGGSVSAEHGIGLEKKSYLKYSRTPAEIALMKTIKRTMDPNNILNPGKLFD